MTKRAPLSVTPANPWVKILTPGTHTPMRGIPITFSAADVSAKVTAIKAQLETGFQPPLVMGHPKHNSPRVGTVIDAKFEGDAAYVKVDELTPEFAESCRKGEFRYNSPAFYANGALRHLGILGGWNPAIKEQDAIEFGEGIFAESDASLGGSSSQVVQFASESDWESVVGSALQRMIWKIKTIGRILRGQRESIIAKDGIEAADKLLPAWDIKDLEEFDVSGSLFPPVDDDIAPEPAAFGDPAATGRGAAGVPPVAGTQAPVAPVLAPGPQPTHPPSAREIELQAKLDAANLRLSTIDGDAATRAFGERLDKAADEGRLAPKLRANLEKLHASLTSGELAFGEGDPIPLSLESVIDALPKIVEFGELGEGRTTKQTTNPVLADAERRANASKGVR